MIEYKINTRRMVKKSVTTDWFYIWLTILKFLFEVASTSKIYEIQGENISHSIFLSKISHFKYVHVRGARALWRHPIQNGKLHLIYTQHK